MVKHLPPKIESKAALKGGAPSPSEQRSSIESIFPPFKMLSNIPTGTALYMLPSKCEFRGAPEPRRLEAILHHTRDGPRFSVPAGGPQPARDQIHLGHLVNFYSKYVSQTSGYVDAHPLEFLFVADDDLHKDRSLAALELDRLEGKEFDENYNCEWCAPRACACCPCCEFHEDEEEEMAAAVSVTKPVQLDVAAVMARLQSIEEKVTQSLACHEMLRRLEEMRISMLPK